MQVTVLLGPIQNRCQESGILPQANFQYAGFSYCEHRRCEQQRMQYMTGTLRYADSFPI